MTDKTAAPADTIPSDGKSLPTEVKDNVEAAIESAITKYGPGVALAVCVIIIASAAFAFWVQRNRNLAGETWSAVTTSFQDRDIKGLVSVAESARTTKAGTMAMLNAGALELNNGLEKLLKDKVKAKEEITAAIAKLEQAKDSQYGDKLTKDQATFSLAYAHEALGDFEKALPLYEALAADETCQFHSMARSGVERCQSPDIKAFQEAFAKWEPSSAQSAPGELRDILNGNLDLPPSEDLKLPEEGTTPESANPDNDSLPSLPDLTPPASDTNSTTEAGQDETKKEGENTEEAKTEGSGDGN